MNSQGLEKLAQSVGWIEVNREDSYVKYEYKKIISLNEAISRLLRIYFELSEDQFLETLYVIKSVLPKKLQKKINGITRSLKPSDIVGVVDTITFAVDQYKKSSAYYKLHEYGKLIGVDIKEKGFDFDYELSRKKIKSILSLIESSLPMETAPKVAKITKIEYKIAALKDKTTVNVDTD